MGANIEKNGFVFYKSYYEAIEILSAKRKLLAYQAIIKYGLYNEVTQDLPPQVSAMLKMAMPTIDANTQKYNKKKRKMANDDFDKMCNEQIPLPQKGHSSKEADEFIEDESDDFEE